MHPLDQIEAERKSHQRRLDEAMGQDRRNRTGQFSTPGPLAEAIVRFCLQEWQKDPQPIRFLEPSIGTGTFFSALARTFHPDAIAQASGIEIDAEHAVLCRQLWMQRELTVERA